MLLEGDNDKVKNDRYSLVVAYIVFLILSVFVYFASMIFKFNYSVWKQIVAAATVASYFFSMAGFLKAQVGVHKRIISSCENLINLYIKQDEVFRKTVGGLKKVASEKCAAEEIEAAYTSTVDAAKKLIEYNSSKIKRSERYVFGCNTLGFLFFFCIVIFDVIYVKISNFQDLLTLLAFIVVLISDYMSEYASEKFSECFENLCSQTQENVNSLNKSYQLLIEKTSEERC